MAKRRRSLLGDQKGIGATPVPVPRRSPPAEQPAEEQPAEEQPAYVSPPTRSQEPVGDFDLMAEFFDGGAASQQSGNDRFEALYLDADDKKEVPKTSSAADAFEDLYVSDDSPGRPSATPPPAEPVSQSRFEEDDAFFLDDDSVPGPAGGPPKVLILGAILLFVMLFAAAAIALSQGGGAPEPEARSPVRSAPPSATSSGLELRNELMKEQAPDTGTQAGEGEAEGADAAKGAAAAPAPVPAAAPAPRPAPSPVPVAKTGTLQIVANRRVVVYLDGNPLGYTPQKVPVLPGAHTLSASMPGRPDSEQVKQIDVSSGTVQRVEFSF